MLTKYQYRIRDSIHILGVCVLFFSLIPGMACSKRRPDARKSDLNPVWTQVERATDEHAEIAQLVLSRDPAPLYRAFLEPLPTSPGEAISIKPGSAVVLLHRNPEGWLHPYEVPLGILEATTFDNVRFLIGIKETKNSVGSYVPLQGSGSRRDAWQVTWEVRLLSWPDLKPMAGEAFVGDMPETVINPYTLRDQTIGAPPIAKLAAWLIMATGGLPNPPGEHSEFVRLVYLGDSDKIALLAWDEVTIWKPSAGSQVKSFSVRGASHKLTGQRLKELEKEGITRVGSLPGLAASPDGRRIAAGGNDDSGPNAKPVSYVWDVDEAKELFELPGGGAPAFSPDGNSLATASSENGICIWDAATGIRIKALEESTGIQYGGLGFTGDGRFIWAVAHWRSNRTVAPGGKVILWDIASGKRARTFSSDGGDILEIAYAPISNTAITLEVRGEFPNEKRVSRMWNLLSTDPEDPMEWPWKHAPFYTQGVAISPDGKRAAVHDLRTIVVFDPETRSLVRSIELPQDLVALGKDEKPVSFSPDGRRLAIIDKTGVSLVQIE